MSYVNFEECKAFYRKSQLNVESIWPSHTVCARALHSKSCVWRNGAVLMLRQNYRWSLMGFGVAGPGCRLPARFMDYTMNINWVKQRIARIGRPAITRIGQNQLVMRRTLSKLQRYGLCDPEEVKDELFTDHTYIIAKKEILTRRIRYNFTVVSNMEYSCIVFKAAGIERKHYIREPYIRLRRWCTSPNPMCYSFRHLQIDFYVVIYFSGDFTYKVSAYGEEARIIDMKKMTAYMNNKREFPRTNKDPPPSGLPQNYTYPTLPKSNYE